MQLDQTRIAIRERGFGEILGLALQVARAHAVSLLLATIVGVTPFALLNCVLLYSYVDQMWIEDTEEVLGYVTLLLLLMALEAPFATSFITLLMGQVTFTSKINVRQIASDYFRSLPQMILFLGIVRPILMWIVLMPYWYRPYVGELILLERNPLRQGRQRRLTTRRRSQNLHANSEGELVGRWFLSIAAALLLIGPLYLGTSLMVEQLLSVEVGKLVRYLVLVQGVLWLIFSWMAVVRFLSYLDLRIRREGWEVELLMRAEADRLRRGLGLAGA